MNANIMIVSEPPHAPVSDGGRLVRAARRTRASGRVVSVSGRFMGHSEPECVRRVFVRRLKEEAVCGIGDSGA